MSGFRLCAALPAGMTVMQKFPLSKCHSSLIRLYTRPGSDHTLMS